MQQSKALDVVFAGIPGSFTYKPNVMDFLKSKQDLIKWVKNGLWAPGATRNGNMSKTVLYLCLGLVNKTHKRRLLWVDTRPTVREGRAHSPSAVVTASNREKTYPTFVAQLPDLCPVWDIILVVTVLW